MRHKKRIVILVEGGVVSSVYAEDELVDVEILDLDTDDPIQQSMNESVRMNLLKDVRENRLVSII